MEPQTPPARRVGPIYTPSTPRHGPLQDTTFLDTRKTLFAQEQQAHMLTPRMTPRRRVLHPCKTPQRGSGRQGKRSLVGLRLNKIDEGVYLSKPGPAGPLTHVNVLHPHHNAPKEPGAGMWYVFRGKKMWRPFRTHEKPLEPVSLFDSAEQFDSDSETDIE